MISGKILYLVLLSLYVCKIRGLGEVSHLCHEVLVRMNYVMMIYPAHNRHPVDELLPDPCVTNSLDPFSPLSAPSSPRSVTPTTPKSPPPRGVSLPPLQPPRSVHKGCCYCRRKGCSARKHAPVSTRAPALLPPLATRPGPTWSHAAFWEEGLGLKTPRVQLSLEKGSDISAFPRSPVLSPHKPSLPQPISRVGFPRVGLETGKGGRGCMSPSFALQLCVKD